jgi:hypothetical protein
MSASAAPANKPELEEQLRRLGYPRAVAARMTTAAYSAGVLRVEALLRRNWGYSKRQRNVDKVFEATWVNEPGMVDVQPAQRELSVVCRLPVFLALHHALARRRPTSKHSLSAAVR